MKNKIRKLRGFTLIETFVAITILMIIVLGPMSLLSRALQDARYIGDKITATYLAQEGVELMINDRNKGVPFEISNCPLKFDNIYGYQCSTGNPTIFSRKIEVKADSPDPLQREIVSIVTVAHPGFSPVISSTIIFINP